MRPHDLELLPAPAEGTTEATVARVVRLGFEVRVEIVAGDLDVWAQLTRAAAAELALEPGRKVYVRPSAVPTPVATG